MPLPIFGAACCALVSLYGAQQSCDTLTRVLVRVRVCVRGACAWCVWARPCLQYTRNCMSLIGQIRSHEDALKAAGSIESVPKFVTDVRMNCPHALERIKTGVAATVVVPSHDSRPSAAIVAETVSVWSGRACMLYCVRGVAGSGAHFHASPNLGAPRCGCWRAVATR